MITRSTALSINSVINIPSAMQKKEYPISLRTAFTSAKTKSIYYITVYASCSHYDSLLTEASSISLISLPACSFACVSCALSSFFFVNLSTNSGTISKIFVIPS